MMMIANLHYEQKDHIKISECVKMINKLHYIAYMARLHWTVDLFQQFALIIRYLAHSLPISFILQLCYVVIGSRLQTIVVAYHEFHTHSKTLHRQVTMVCNNQAMQLV